MPEIGQSAPNFTAKDRDGNLISLQDFANQWLVLYFYPKDNTPGCTSEAKEFSAYQNQFEQLKARIVGISPDSEISHRKFIDKHELSIQLLSDPEHQTIEAYGVWRLKKFMGKEYMGVVRSTFLINPEGKIVYIWDKVRVKGHVEAVLKQLQANLA
ncbi:alkyl hydroperoxide reductase/ Thiol specific antioxidant/ Mal allergen [Stanieria sp. NIES-3757]|nr:alkyl hydroperoxide reductase/ Thiol specific antioxidant/ Mal allergen [Stanieria sp. NIES-3757]